MKTCHLCQKQVESVCHICEGRIHRQLDDLGELWKSAHDELLPGRSGNGGRSSEMSIGINVAALSFIAGDDILGLLHEWEKLIRQERKLTPPAFVKKEPNLESEISVAIKFHQVNLEWSMNQEWIIDFAKELKDLHSQGIRAAKRWVEKKRTIKCPTELSDEVCGNRLRIIEDDPLEIFTCFKCETEWTTLRLMLVTLSDPKSEVWLDAEALAKWMNLSERHIRRIAKTKKVSKQGNRFNVKEMIMARNEMTT